MPADTSLNAKVRQRVEVAPGLIILRVVPVGWELPDFEPGQYSVLGLPGSAPRCVGADPEPTPPDPNKLVRRAYSIASSSVAKQYMEFFITLVHSGELTPRLFALKIGDPLFLGKKTTGLFTFRELPEEVNVILMATGTGLAPYMSMVRTYLATHAKRRYAIIHGARHSWDLGYQSELHTLNNLFDNFNYYPIISRPKEELVEWTGHTGYVQDIWNRKLIEKDWGMEITPNNTHFFLCGNPAMITQVTESLIQHGYMEFNRRTGGEIHCEKYW